MRKKIELKIMYIENQMSKYETKHLYYLTIDWMLLHAQRQVLGEILKDMPPPRVKKQL